MRDGSAMTAIAQNISDTGLTYGRSGADLSAEVFTDLACVEALWRNLEAGRDCVGTPYQRFDWISAFVESEHGAADVKPSVRIMVLRDSAGHAQALLPTQVRRRHGMAVASVIGDKHANFHMPLYASRTAAAWPPQAFEAALARAGRSAGIDVFALDHQPCLWDGLANPIAANGQRCASDAYGLQLGPDPDTTLRTAFSGDARKKLRAKERKLIEAVGPVAYRQAEDPQEISAILEAFCAQKASRFTEKGVANPYADAAIREFLLHAARYRGGAGDSGPAIEIHALIATTSGRILATFIGAGNRERFSGMCNSFDADPEIARFSPGELLLYHLIGRQAGAGRKSFDLGIGEARYKSSICDQTVELVETCIPVTLKGHLYRSGAMILGRGKRRIKQSPKLWDLIQRWRRMRRTPFSANAGSGRKLQ